MSRSGRTAHPYERSRVRRRRGGFTLVELLVVLGIIIVLAAIMLPMINSARRKAGVAAIRSDLQTISLGLEAYKQVFRDYPRAYDPDWTKTSRNQTTGHERVLAKYLFGWDPSTGLIDYQGVRGPTGKKFGPYLTSEKFKILERDAQGRDQRNVGKIDGTSEFGQFRDEGGQKEIIQYYPRWHNTNPSKDNANPSKAGALLGSVTRAAVGPTGFVAQFNRKDGLAYKPDGDVEGDAHRWHLLYMLGDGQPNFGIKTSTDYNAIIDPGEELRFRGDFILVHASFDGDFGMRRDTSGPKNFEKCDDVYNFER